MTANDVYKKYIVKVEKNSTNDNFSTDREKVALMFNELSLRVLRFYTNNRSVNIRKQIQSLLVDDKPLITSEKHLDHYDFDIPKDYFDWSNIRAIASRGECKRKEIFLYEIRDEDRGSFLNNIFLKPSFSYRESPYIFSDNKIKVFVEPNTTIDKLYMSYYKTPTKIRLMDEDDPESQFIEEEINLPEEIIDRIISAMAGEFKINNNDQAFQFDKLRQNENIAQATQ